MCVTSWYIRCHSCNNNNFKNKKNAKAEDKFRCKEKILFHWYR